MWIFDQKHFRVTNDPFIALTRLSKARPPLPPLKLEKIWYFGVKSWFFTRNTPKISHLPPQLEKIWFFGVKSWFFTRNIPKFFAPPSARRIFFKCTPLTGNPGSAPEMWQWNLLFRIFSLTLWRYYIFIYNWY